MGRVLLVYRLAVRDLRRHAGQTALLLLVIAAACGVNLAVNVSSRLYLLHGSFEVVHDSAIFGFGNIGDAVVPGIG